MTTLTPADLQRIIAADSRAAARVCRYLDQHGIKHSGKISGATLAAVLGVDSRTWRRYVGGEREMPTAARRLLTVVSGVNCELPMSLMTAPSRQLSSQ